MSSSQVSDYRREEAHMYIGLGTIVLILVVVLLLRMFSGRRT
jgi:hypothetical protein